MAMEKILVEVNKSTLDEIELFLKSLEKGCFPPPKGLSKSESISYAASVMLRNAATDEVMFREGSMIRQYIQKPVEGKDYFKMPKD